MERIKFCPKCHREAYRLIRDNGNIKIVQGNKTVINVSDKSSVKMNISCPSGHSVPLIIKPKEEEGGSKKD